MHSRHCIFCSNNVDSWAPFRIREADISPFLKRLDTIGSNVERFACPHCESIDRERHLRLYLEHIGYLGRPRSGVVLHIAPEIILRRYIQGHGFAPYISGDLHPPHESTQKIDVQAIPYPAGTFDLVVCNHVLEHVENAGAAFSELYRVLKPGGRVICQTPYAEKLASTFEESALQSEADRMFFYGQEDHVRLFGRDIEQYFRDTGFVGRLAPHAEILPDIDPELYGVNEREPFFDFVRPD